MHDERLEKIVLKRVAEYGSFFVRKNTAYCKRKNKERRFVVSHVQK